MRKSLISFLIFFSLFLGLYETVYSASDYVLPYPSSMPGSKLYKIHLVWEKIMKYWYFGNFGQFTYNLKQSDKYLVESKTLFEYRQYLLASQALEKSDKYIIKAKEYLAKSQIEGKNIEQKQKVFKNANLKHIEVLSFVKTIIPDRFFWQPEKSSSTNLNLKKSIDESIKIRNNLSL